MNDLTTTRYFELLTTFLKAIDQEEAIGSINKEEGIVEWEVRNLLLRVIPHRLSEEEVLENQSEPDSIIVEADLMLLDLENRTVNHDRFLILHQLNAVSRVTTGIVAFITDEGMLFINKIVPLENLDQEGLAGHIGKVIKAAEDLYDGWNELGEAFDPSEVFLKEEEEKASLSLDQRA